MKLINRLSHTIGRIAVLAAVTLVVDSRADEAPSPVPHTGDVVAENVAAKATDPSAVMTQLGFFYWNTRDEYGDAISQTALFQPVLPLSKRNVFRPALPLITTMGDDGATGIGDLFLLDAQMFPLGKGTAGLGLTASLPIASQDQFGSEKYEVGVTGLYIYKGIPKNIFGFLAYSLSSVAGADHRDNVAKLYFQPLWVGHYDWGYLALSDQMMQFDFEKRGRGSYPIGLRIGKVYGGPTPLNLVIEPYYTFNDSADNQYGMKIACTFIMPGVLRH
jgi:hypothetical protein